MSSAESASAIRREQLQLLFGAMPTSMIATLLNATLLVVVQWPVLSHRLLLGWLALVFAVTVARGFSAWVFGRLPPGGGDSEAWYRHFLVGVLAAGALWGAAGVLLFPAGEVTHQVFLAFVLSGMCVGAVSVLAPTRVGLISYVLLVMGPIALRFLLEGGPMELVMGVMGLALIVVTLGAGRRINDSFLQNIRLRLEAGEREDALRLSEQRMRLLFDHAPLGVVHYDRRGVVQGCNPALLELLGSSDDTLIGFPLLQRLRDPGMVAAVQTSLDGGVGHYDGEFRILASRRQTPIRGLFAAVLGGRGDQHGEVIGGLGFIEDVTEHKQAQARIEREVYYDPLTGLPNRRLLLDRLDSELARARRHDGNGAVLFLDLDRFKTINDSLGHAVGDALLQAVAKRLTEQLRREDTVARLGGDEFVALLPEVNAECTLGPQQGALGAGTVAEKLRSVLEQPFRVAEHELHVSSSIGIALFPGDENDAMDLLKHADAAMYQVKSEGRNAVKFFHPDMQQRAEERLKVEHELRNALSREELRLFLQPQVDVGGTPVGAEALLRWQHPELGLLGPAKFITVAEEAGLVVPVGAWVLAESCRWLRACRESGHGFGRVAVNVSARQFRQPDLVEMVSRCLDECAIEDGRLELEITEGVLLTDVDDAVAKMEALRERGVLFSIDDFGTGYSSLSYLKRLPVDTLKIDRSFVRDLSESSNDAAIVEAIIGMAHHLDMHVVAEGVETREQFEFLRERDCDLFQGYYFGWPVEVGQFPYCKPLNAQSRDAK